MTAADPFQIALPCRLVTLRVHVGPEDGATILEDLVARAILAGRTTVPLQSKLFGIPQRIVVDVVHSLWMKGYVMVDFDHGRLDLSDSAREILGAGEKLVDSAAELKLRKFLFEPVTGRFFPEADGTRRPRERSLDLPPRHGISESDLRQPELVRAVRDALRREKRKGLRTNVLSVSFGSPVIREPTYLRWLHVNVQARQDPDSGRVSVEVMEQRDWDEQARRRLSTHVGGLGDREPDHPFVQRLRARTAVSLEPPEPVERLLQRQEAQLSDLPDTLASQVEERQRVLLGYTRRIQERLAAADRSRAAATVVSTTAGHWWAVEDLVRSADRQILLAAPAIEYQPLNELLPALRERLDQGVHLVVLWGRANADALQPKVRTALHELADRYPNRVLFDERSARTDACLVVQDDRRALVGSHSPLATRPPDDQREVSILVEPAEHGPSTPEAVTDLLYWARETFPNWMKGTSIMVRCGDPPDDRPESPGSSVEEPPAPSIDPERADRDAVRLWAETWANYHAALVQAKADAEEVGPTVAVVRDGEHRDLIWTGLRTATRRLVITDDRIEPAVANEQLTSAVRARANAGADVHVAHPAPRRAGGRETPFVGPDGGARSAVRVRLVRFGGRLVVADDSTLLGSYSPLGTDDASARFAVTRRSHVGLHVQAERLAAEVVATLGLPTGGDATSHVPAEATAPRRPRSRGAAAATLLLEARHTRGGADFGPWVAARLQDLDDPSDVLAAWQRAGVPSWELRPAVAAVLRQGGPPGPEKRADWVRWLVEDAWRRRCFVEAGLIARLLPDPPEPHPPDPLASASAAAVAIELGPVGYAVSDAALAMAQRLDDTGPPAAADLAGPLLAAGVGALAEVLLWAGPEGAQALSLLTLPAAWRDLADDAVALHRDGAGALPLEAVAAGQTRAADLAALCDRRDGLLREIDKIERLRRRFDFGPGAALHSGLFSPNGLLTTIRAVVLGDPSGWARLRPVLPTDVRRHLDDVIARAGEEPMAWSRQGAFRGRIERIVRSARVLALAGPAPGSAATPSLHRFEPIAKRVADTWDVLYSEATAIPGDYDPPAVALLDELSPLVWWAREQA